MIKSDFKIPVLLAIFVGLVTILGACAPVYAPGVGPGEVTSLPGFAPNEGITPSEELTERITVPEMVPDDSIVLEIVPSEGLMGEVLVPEVISIAPAIQLGSADIVNGDLVVEAKISGFILDQEAIGKAKVEGRGHWHLYIDDKLAGFTAADTITVSQDKLAEFSSGIHEIKIELHNNDHSLVSETAWANTKIDFGASIKAPDVGRDFMIGGGYY